QNLYNSDRINLVKVPNNFLISGFIKIISCLYWKISLLLSYEYYRQLHKNFNNGLETPGIGSHSQCCTLRKSSIDSFFKSLRRASAWGTDSIGFLKWLSVAILGQATWTKASIPLKTSIRSSVISVRAI